MKTKIQLQLTEEIVVFEEEHHQNDIINSNNGNDTLSGMGGDDLLLRDNGNVCLDGAVGKDLLLDCNGNDRLRGGSGNDLFVLAATEGTDTVKDFKNDSDRFGSADLRGIVVRTPSQGVRAAISLFTTVLLMAVTCSKTLKWVATKSTSTSSLSSSTIRGQI